MVEIAVIMVILAAGMRSAARAAERAEQAPRRRRGGRW